MHLQMVPIWHCFSPLTRIGEEDLFATPLSHDYFKGLNAQQRLI